MNEFKKKKEKKKIFKWKNFCHAFKNKITFCWLRTRIELEINKFYE